MLDDRTCPSTLFRALCSALCLVLSVACTSPRELRASVDEIERQWNDETIAEDSLEELVEHLRELGSSGAQEPTALASIVRLSQVVARNPAYYVRAEALSAAWQLAAERPALPLREDDIDVAAFNADTLRFDELMQDPSRLESEEAFALIDTIGSARFPVSRLGPGLDLAEVVVTQSLWGATPALRSAFAEHAEAIAMHALTCTTLSAATANSPVESVAFLRQAAVENASHLHIDLALNLVGTALDRDPESLVALAAMEQLALIAEQATDEQLKVMFALARRRDEPALSARADVLEARLVAEGRQLRTTDAP
ncbi:MAG: hypothetical protein DHS20C15_01760 [Planctomycetota bacterium]|nr:MAG: hypothetical protein DHS20C15_01760 [Planctomycetota bacterium]